MRLPRCLLAQLRSRPRLSRIQTRSVSSGHEYRNPWLSALKTAQLTEIAQETGIRSAGPKHSLAERIDQELQKWGHESAGPADPGPNGLSPAHQPTSPDVARGMSILSIDMGIKNLAYTHLIVPGKSENSDSLPILNAWRRIDVSRIPDGPQPSSAGAKRTDPSSLDQMSSPLTVPVEGEEEEKSLLQYDEFWPLALAPRAYTLVSTLLDVYKPTHVLIERQRFRTNRATSVFEWTLRVGVFEGMLYSTFLTLARERGGEGPLVLPIEPARVARYLAQKAMSSPEGRAVEDEDVGGNGREKLEATRRGKGAEEKSEDVKARSLSSRETKKIKIDMVGSWLTATSSQASSSALPSPQRKLDIGPDKLLHRWIDVYLSKWPGAGRGDRPRNRSKKGQSKEQDAIWRRMPKLDDLADCLVQGVTWLDWMRMRDRVAHEGPSALGLREKKSKKSRGQS